jgi:cyclopropane fatty-acyl-phospholipid synthase-like methyltransferase
MMESSGFSVYYDEEIISETVKRGGHRDVVGGMWEEIGSLQLNFLKKHGLLPDNTLLDIGCGSLRLGTRAVDYLIPENYWGTDISVELLNAGYEREIVPAGLSDKLPRSHLHADGDFNFSALPTEFDFAIAQSLFTHLPLNHMRLCLTNLGGHLTSQCTFFFTVFMPSDGQPVTESHLQSTGGVLTHTHRDPFHYSFADIQYVVLQTPWSVELIGNWDHPRNQMMVMATIK